MNSETPNKQFEMALKHEITKEDIPSLLQNISHHIEIKPVITENDDGLEVSLAKSGVTSTFKIDTYKGTVTLDEERSYDLFDGDEDYTDISSKPIQSAEKIHEERQQQLEAAIADTIEPPLIED